MENNFAQLSNTLIKGRVTELKVITYFLEQGYVVSTPEVPCQYDILLDIGKQVLKIQIKTSRLSPEQDYIVFNTSSVTHNSKGYKQRSYSAEMVDYFCTFYNNQCYLVPFENCGSKEKRLRIIPTKNGQVKGINFAKDFLAEEVLKKINE